MLFRVLAPTYKGSASARLYIHSHSPFDDSKNSGQLLKFVVHHWSGLETS